MDIETIKNKLKQNPLFFKVNAQIKSAQLLYELKKYTLQYEQLYDKQQDKYCASRIIQDFKRKFAKQREKNEKLNVLWIGANWDQDNTGFLQSLSKVSNMYYLVQPNGTYGFLNSVAGVQDKVLQFNNDIILGTVEDIQKKVTIDLVMGQMWANYIHPNTLHTIQKMGIPIINIAMDDRLPALWHSYKGYRLGSVGLKSGVDLVLTTAEECCKWYHVEGIPALYWPLASNSDVFTPEEWNNKTYDISFIGNNYGIRGDIVRGLKDAGINVAAFGNGWELGYATADMAPSILAKSKIVLGIATVAHTKNLFTLKLRDFDAPMSGALYITQRNTELYNFYKENEEIVFYDSIPDLINKVKYYLQHQESLQRIANKARLRAKQEHTWESRLQEIFKYLNSN